MAEPQRLVAALWQASRFNVVATVSGTHSGTATWTVTGGTATPTNTLARTIAAGCPTG